MGIVIFCQSLSRCLQLGQLVRAAGHNVTTVGHADPAADVIARQHPVTVVIDSGANAALLRPLIEKFRRAADDERLNVIVLTADPPSVIDALNAMSNPPMILPYDRYTQLPDILGQSPLYQVDSAPSSTPLGPAV